MRGMLGSHSAGSSEKVSIGPNNQLPPGELWGGLQAEEQPTHYYTDH